MKHASIILIGLAEAIILAAAVFFLFDSTAATAHTSYCGHASKAYNVALPNGFMQYEDHYVHGYGAGPHYHSYNTTRRVNGQGTYYFVHAHYGRQCPNHPI